MVLVHICMDLNDEARQRMISGRSYIGRLLLGRRLVVESETCINYCR